MSEVDVIMENEDKKGLHTWVEVVNAKTLKKEIIDENPELEGFNGLVLRKIHKSNIKVSYEKIEGGLAGFLDKKVKGCKNLPEFVRIARERLC